MHNELTQKDIRLMREELDYRRIQLRPKLLEAVKEARGFGDLSENFEYKAAKQEKNRNESRIRFLENMIRTAVVISDRADADTVGLYDRVTVYLEDEGDDLLGYGPKRNAAAIHHLADQRPKGQHRFCLDTDQGSRGSPHFHHLDEHP